MSESKSNPVDDCLKVSKQWTEKTAKFSGPVVKSSTNLKGTTYCIIRVNEHHPEYTMPVHIKLTLGKHGGVTAKRWGIR